ncbi:MAG: O-antigen ligase family protein [Acidobacteria bacterium]|nr:O-antigen ligase family protein [Acidobacteriota bacterium]
MRTNQLISHNIGIGANSNSHGAERLNRPPHSPEDIPKPIQPILFAFLAMVYLPVQIVEMNLFKYIGFILAAIALISVLRTKNRLLVHPFSIALFVMILAGTLGTLDSGLGAITGIIKMVMNLLLFWIIAYYISSPRAETFLVFSLAFGGLLTVISGLAEIGNFETAMRLSGFIGNPNGYGQTCIQSAILAIGFINYFRYKRQRLLSLIILMLCGIGLLFSQSRGATVAMLSVLFGLLILKHTRNWGLVLAAGVMIAASVIIPAKLIDRWETAFSTQKGGRESGIEMRLDLVNRGWRIFEEHPLIGVGFNNTRYEMLRDDPNKSKVTHNFFVEGLSETGIIGMAGFLFILFRTGWAFFTRARQKTLTRDFLGITFYLLLISVCIGQLSSGNYLHPIWYILFGIGANVSRRTNKNTQIAINYLGNGYVVSRRTSTA